MHTESKQNHPLGGFLNYLIRVLHFIDNFVFEI